MVDKQFRMDNEATAHFLRDLADSVEDGEVGLDGEDWKVYQELSEKSYARVYRDDSGLEVAFKFPKNE